MIEHELLVFGKACLMPGFVFLLEVFGAGWQKSSLRKFVFACNMSMFSDVFYFVLYSCTQSGVLVYFGSFGLVYWANVVQKSELSFLAPVRLNTGFAPLNALLFFLLFYFVVYCQHWLGHTKMLWSMHRLHHASTVMNPLVSARHHISETVLGMAVVAAPLSIIPIGAPYLIAVGFIASFHDFVLHADVDWDWGWFGRWVLQSPKAHRLHHSKNPEHFGKNIALLVILDRIFGTYFEGEIPEVEVGVADFDYHRYGPIFDHLADWWRLLRGIAHSLAEVLVSWPVWGFAINAAVDRGVINSGQIKP